MRVIILDRRWVIITLYKALLRRQPYHPLPSSSLTLEEFNVGVTGIRATRADVSWFIFLHMSSDLIALSPAIVATFLLGA